MKSKQIAKDFHWVGSLDPALRVFDIIMETEFGTTYNSYLLKGSEKTALFESSKLKCFDSYIEGLTGLVRLEDIDYLIVDHTEPDHSGSVEKLLALNPKMKLVGSAAAINFMKEICNKDFSATLVKSGDELSLGDKTLQFFSVPNLHWPDSIFTYIPEIETLVTCDMFGCHYSDEGITDDQVKDEAGYRRALRYYFDNIMGPFKKDVLSAIRQIKDLKIRAIATGHGPVLVRNPLEIVETYREWASDANPNAKKTVVIPYVSAYGYTEMMAQKIEEGIRAAGDLDVRSYDLVSADQGEVLADLAWADGILFGTPTIVGEALKPIWDLTTCMFAKTHGGKFASAFGSYGWSGEGVPNIMARLRQLKLKLYGDGLRARFKPGDAELQEAYEFGYGFGASVLSGEIVKPKKAGQKKQVWKCLICGELVEGDEAPMACPVCGVGPEQFVEVEAGDTDFVSDVKASYVIVGNGAAGTAAAEEIRKRNQACTIEIISREAVPAYNRPMLTKGILSDLDAINLFLKPEHWYAENRITLTLNANVTAIDPAGKVVRLESGESKPYDKLVLATGAESFRPPIPGADLKGVFAIRTLADVYAIQKYIPDVKSAAVIGGGVLGLEAAWEIKKAGKAVSVIETGDGLMRRQLDKKGGELLQEAAEQAGVSIHTSLGVAEITGKEGRASAVTFTDGSAVNAELVILSTGVKQNTELAKAAGIQAERSIEVNERMETSAADVYACGDCAAYKGSNYAIWMQAAEMGKTAGVNAAGDEAAYETVIPSNAFNGFGISLFAVGDNGSDPAKKYKTFEIHDTAKKTYRKLYFVNNRFSGGILLGDVSESARLLEAYKNGDSLEKLLK
ncbi:MAG: FAD-dependent oxidoreductase [Clostridiales Family XIII bacterium]|jgi:flavorubredoxin/NADPH-dependent 2,4-dienoyl-CoA reductase/sulfur reductase-like enzyme|nr:FAD-dependent oxidoreductase [Clostridiales Family XIII bacterium]